MSDRLLLESDVIAGLVELKEGAIAYWGRGSQEHNLFRDAIDSLKKVPAANVWLPIETAPKDGTKIDVWIVSQIGGHRNLDVSWIRFLDGSGDWYSQGFPVSSFHENVKITHWRPVPPHQRVKVMNKDVSSISDDDLLRRAVRNARGKSRGYTPRWQAVRHCFCLGSTYSHQLCIRFGFDPDEKVRR